MNITPEILAKLREAQAAVDAARDGYRSAGLADSEARRLRQRADDLQTHVNRLAGRHLAALLADRERLTADSVRFGSQAVPCSAELKASLMVWRDEVLRLVSAAVVDRDAQRARGDRVVALLRHARARLENMVGISADALKHDIDAALAEEARRAGS